MALADIERHTVSLVLPEPLLYDVDAAARAIDVSPRLVRRLIADGELPTVRIGRLVRVRVSDLQTYVDAHRSGVSN